MGTAVGSDSQLPRASPKVELSTTIASWVAKEQMASSKTVEAAEVEKRTRVEEPDTCLPKGKLEVLVAEGPLGSSSEVAQSTEGSKVTEVAGTVMKDTRVPEIHIVVSAAVAWEQPVGRMAAGKLILRAPVAEASSHRMLAW